MPAPDAAPPADPAAPAASSGTHETSRPARKGGRAARAQRDAERLTVEPPPPDSPSANGETGDMPAPAGALPGEAPRSGEIAGVDDATGAAPTAARADDELPFIEEEPPFDEAELDEEDERARAFLAGGAYATVAIDRYDDLPAIFGKIDTAASPRVALVARRGNHELQRALSMRRLQRHLDLHGKDLILVTRSRALRIRAREEGLPAVGHLRRVNFQTYGRQGLQLGWLTLPLPSLGGLLGLAVLTAALLAGLAVFLWYVPKGNVSIFLPTNVHEDTLDLTLDAQATTINLQTMSVPARRREVTITRSFYRPATGVVHVPKDHAAVALRFTNRTNARVLVPQGTNVIAANNVRFTVDRDVDLPRLGATGDALALAQQPGTIGNVPPNSITRIDGDLAPRVAVTNPAPGEKGTDVPQQVVAEADVEGVRAFAEPVLIDAANQDLLQRLAETATIFAASATAQITEVVANPPVGVPAKYTDVKVTGKVSMLTADDADLRQVYVHHFRPRIGADEMLLEDEFKTNVEGIGEPERAFDRLPVRVRAQALTAPFLDRRQLQQALAGKGRKGVEQVVRERVAAPVPPRVTISPGWAPRLPRRAERISITFAAAPRQ